MSESKKNELMDIVDRLTPTKVIQVLEFAKSLQGTVARRRKQRVEAIFGRMFPTSASLFVGTSTMTLLPLRLDGRHGTALLMRIRSLWLWPTKNRPVWFPPITRSSTPLRRKEK